MAVEPQVALHFTGGAKKFYSIFLKVISKFWLSLRYYFYSIAIYFSVSRLLSNSHMVDISGNITVVV